MHFLPVTCRCRTQSCRIVGYACPASSFECCVSLLAPYSAQRIYLAPYLCTLGCGHMNISTLSPTVAIAFPIWCIAVRRSRTSCCVAWGRMVRPEGRCADDVTSPDIEQQHPPTSFEKQAVEQAKSSLEPGSPPQPPPPQGLMGFRHCCSTTLAELVSILPRTFLPDDHDVQASTVRPSTDRSGEVLLCAQPRVSSGSNGPRIRPCMCCRTHSSVVPSLRLPRVLHHRRGVQ